MTDLVIITYDRYANSIDQDIQNTVFSNTKLTQNNSNTQTGDSSRYRGGRCSVSNTNVLTVLQIYFSVGSKPMFPIPKFLFLWRTVKQISLSSLIQCYLEFLDCTDY